MYDRDNGSSPIQVKKYNQLMYDDLVDFAEQATKDGLFNNSIERMKLDITHYWVAYYDDKIIHVNGLQEKNDGWWIVRQATLHKYHGLLKMKKFFGASSVAFRYTLPVMIEWSQSINNKPIYFSTNVDNHAGRWMTRVDRHIRKLCVIGVFSYIEKRIINNVEQRAYCLNIPEYWKYYDNMVQELNNET